MIDALTCGHHKQHVHAKQLSKNHQGLKYKKWKSKICEEGDSSLNKMSSENKIPTIASLMEIP